MGQLIGMVDVGVLKPSIRAALDLETPVDSFDIDPADLFLWFSQASRRVGESFLRYYWYDAVWEPPDNRHGPLKAKFDKLDETPGVQVRLGRLKSKPQPWRSKLTRALNEMNVNIEELKNRFDFSDVAEQKGVDTLIVLDMIRLAQVGAYDTLILIAGDGDFAEAARAVQDTGKQVILAHPVGAGVSPELKRVADERVVINDVQLRRLLHAKPGLRSYRGEAS